MDFETRKSQIVVCVWPRGTLQVAVELSVWGAQVTGEATYVDDIPLPANTLYAAVVLSTRAHAKLLSVDASDAIKVVTAFDSGSSLGRRAACWMVDHGEKAGRTCGRRVALGLHGSAMPRSCWLLPEYVAARR